MTIRPEHIPKIERWRRGDVLEARHLDQPRRTIDALTGSIQPPAQLDAPRDAEEDGAGGEIGNVVRELFQVMTVTAELDNSLQCSLADGGTVEVAKQPHLRGATATRTVAGEEQVIIESYTDQPTIFAMNNAGGNGTGLADVSWLEIGPGRQWAKKFEE